MSVIRTILLSVTLLFSGLVSAGPVNINTADAAAISEAMNGVGLKKAQAIVDYRNKHGAFTSVDDLAQVKGIGNKTLQINRSKLTVEAIEKKN